MHGAAGALAALRGLLGPPMVLITIVGAVFAVDGLGEVAMDVA
jgi:hypothetical protein